MGVLINDQFSEEEKELKPPLELEDQGSAHKRTPTITALCQVKVENQSLVLYMC